MATRPRTSAPVRGAPLGPLLLLTAGVAIAHRALLRWDAFDPVYRDDAEGHLFYDPTTTPPVLVVLLVAWIVWRRREAWRRAVRSASPSRPSSLLFGAALTAAAALLLGVGYRAGAPDLALLSLAAALPGIALVLGGPALARGTIVPSLLLVWSTPPPGPLLNAATWPLQLATAEGVAAALRLAGIDHVARLDLIFVGDYVFQVIETCAGLRAQQSLVLAALVLGEALDAPPIRRVVMVLLAPPLAFVINVGRVLWIVLVTQETAHFTQGLVAVAVGVALLGAVDAILARRWPDRSREAGSDPADPRSTRRPRALAAAWLVIAAATAVLGAMEPPPPAPRRPLAFPTRFDEWRASGARPDLTFLGSVGAERTVSLRLREGDRRASLVVWLDDRRTRSRSALSGKTAILESGARRLSVDRFEDGDRGRVDVLRIRSWLDGEYHLVHHWRAGFASTGRETVRALAAFDRWPGRPHAWASVVRLSIPLGRAHPSEAEWQRADATLRELGRSIEEATRVLRVQLTRER